VPASPPPEERLQEAAKPQRRRDQIEKAADPEAMRAEKVAEFREKFLYLLAVDAVGTWLVEFVADKLLSPK
jgi:hypothetical protein